ncbi:uncharacterized protein LOC133837130 [Drosophila sulfurigaster albostrigata]|uniref:uncharacterized protein LOC133837130 n=1 Tax=Drosophila sulfurigaster albostrigata TaxID=89887 RepID=UPI002D21EB94|nr:uncharacterized protein LOC133837130 [Drosophila sulfurigaster albostrigata]
MAPTVCSEKKVRVAGMKEARRRGNMGVAQSTTNTSTAVTAATQAAAAGAIQNSVVLNYVAKGSTHSAGRQQRRRMVRVPSRLQHISKSIISSSASTSSSPTSSSSESEQQLERMELDEYTNSDCNDATSIQISRTHSSGSSNNNINIKTVLQPTTANSNSNNYIFGNGGNNNKTSTTAKFCDQMPSADDEDDDDVVDDDDEEEDQGDGDSGYEFALEPIKPHIQQQYHSHNEGLLSIALKTIKLVQRNKLLQKRLAQLQLETSEFIASVLANPENRHFRDKVAVKAESPSKVSNVLLRH